jgi:hypothetical protein
MVVKATREGLVDHMTASGYRIDVIVPFVALPSRNALHRAIRVTNVANNRNVIAVVLDVGPHSDCDDAYVFGGARPLAEQGISRTSEGTGKAANSSGIDLGEWVWNELGMLDNTEVDWVFVN